jgi:hypothetical protein
METACQIREKNWDRSGFSAGTTDVLSVIPLDFS